MAKEQVKSVLKTVRRSQVRLKYILLLVLFFVVAAALSYKLSSRFRIPSVAKDLQLNTPTITAESDKTATVSATPTPTPVAQPQAGEKKPVVNQAPVVRRASTYVVRRGDSLSLLAQRLYGSTRHTAHIAKYNGLKANQHLRTGQVLKIPPQPQKMVKVTKPVKTTKPVAVVKNVKKTTATAKSTYVVQKGDTLSKIAGKKYQNVQKWPVIYRANQKVIGKNPHLIYPKTKLSIPKVTTKTSVKVIRR